MKLTMDKAALDDALSVAIRALSARPALPALDCVLLSASGDELSVTCSDLQIGIHTRAPAAVDIPGAILLPGKLLGEVVRKMEPGEVSLSVSDALVATVRCNKAVTSLQGISADQYPALPQVDDEASIVMRQEMLGDMIRKTVFAVAQDETRPILTGSLLHSTPGELSLVALDGFRMAIRRERYSADDGESGTEARFVAPGRYMNELARILGSAGLARLSFSRSHMMVDMDETRIIIRLLEGEYMRYEQIIPASHKTQLTLSKNALQDSLERAHLLARDGKTSVVSLNIGENNILVSAHSEMGSMREDIPSFTMGDEMDIAFNIRYLLDTLKSIDDEDVVLNLSSAISPCVVAPVNGDSYLHLILPVRMGR